MSNSISTLLIRNLRDVFGENVRSGDAQRSTRLYTEDVVFYDPARVSTVAATRSIASQPLSRRLILTFSYQLIAEPEEVGDGGRVPWVSGRPGDAPAYAGTDFIIARDGRIAAIYLFFDKLS